MIGKAKSKSFILRLLTLFMVACLACGGIFIANAGTEGANEQPPVSKSDLAYYMEGSEDAYTNYGTWETITDGTEGLVATYTGASDRLVLRQVINLYELNMGPIITFRPAPASTGTADFARVRMDLVDAHNPDIRVSYRTQNHPGNLNGEPASYTMVKSHVGSYKGYSHGVQSWCSDDYGTGANFPFYNGDIACISYYYDPVENMSYISSRWKSYVSYVPDGSVNWIVDLDDSSLHGTNVFEGFTTGEVYVEIWVEEFQSGVSRLFIEQYGDYDLSNTALIDNDGPQIKVDLNGYDKNYLPNAIVGSKYPVFDASAFDVYTGKEDVEVKVYYNYYSSGKIAYPVRSDGTFIPSMPGNYSIEYTSIDDRNNKTVKVIDFTAVAAASIEGLSVSFGAVSDTTPIGEAFAIPELDIKGFLGNEKDVNVEITAINAGKELEVINGIIRPTVIGDLTVKMVVTDFVGQKVTKTINLTVTATDKATFVDTPVLPNYLVEGLTYTLPELNAYNFVNGTGDPVKTTAKVVYGSTNIAINNGKFVPSVNNHKDTVDVIYEAVINGKTASYVKSIPVYKVKDGTTLDMTKYFDVVSGNVSATYNSMLLNMVDGEGEFNFINSIYQTAFVLEFTATDTTNDIAEFTTVLTDYNDPSVQISFTYYKQGSKVYFCANGNKSIAPSVEATFNSNQKFELTYDDVTRKISYDSTKSSTISVDKDLNGKDFNGFSGNEYYVSFYMTGGSVGSIALNKINGSAFTGDVRDYVGPRISFVDDYGGDYKIGSEYVLPKAIVSDVLDGRVQVEITVEDPSMKVISSVQGKKLDGYKISEDEKVSIKLNKFGVYYVTYYAVDSYGNRLNFNYTVNVIDDKKPVIKLESKLPTEVEVGSKVHIPNASVSDDKDSGLKCTVMLVLPTGRVETFYAGSDTGFMATETGSYNVIYSARDSEGNVENLVFTITVVEGK